MPYGLGFRYQPPVAHIFLHGQQVDIVIAFFQQFRLAPGFFIHLILLAQNGVQDFARFRILHLPVHQLAQVRRGFSPAPPAVFRSGGISIHIQHTHGMPQGIADLFQFFQLLQGGLQFHVLPSIRFPFGQILPAILLLPVLFVNHAFFFRKPAEFLWLLVASNHFLH